MKTISTIMKTAVVAIAVLFGSKANAQIDLKMNLLGVAFNDYGIYGEYAISENMSAQLGVMYNITKASASIGNNSIERTYAGIKVIPSFRFYFSPDDPTEGFFVEPYFRYKTQKTSGGKLDVPVDDNGNFDESYDPMNTNQNQKYEKDVEYSIRRSKGGFGLAIGRKWVHESGFVFEMYGGFGKNTPTKLKYSDDRVQKYHDKLVKINTSIGIHGRLGLSLGWRF